ncbi:MAG: C69 family dipeptidase [Bacteroidales bacterium]|nr:C69 family dipeptidase [Bacteroidales bacterium]
MSNRLFWVSLLLVFCNPQGSFACTNLIITAGASSDGSVMLVYTNDGEWLYRLDLTPSADHLPGDSIEFVSWRNQTRGKLPQVPHTFGVVGFQMNEFQVAVGETTFTGREELWNKSGFLEYWHLMKLALERARTAREAVLVMTSLAEQYTYGSEGESFSITDPDEAWILEMIGTGTGGLGAVWVAVRIPDGFISAHANMARIGEFPIDDPDNCLYSDNVISFAIERGYYDPQGDEPFRFNEAYNPPSPDRLKYCESRVWSLFTRTAPSLGLSSDYHRGVPGAARYPLWIQPDRKISLADVLDLVRDHYEGTPFDMTTGVAAGPFGNPNRWRPLFWEDGETKYSWERPVSTYNTAFSMIAQSRSWLPDPLGGIVWFGVDDTWFTCYIPVFCSVTGIPKPFATGDIRKFSWDSAWWVFNFVSNYANLRFSAMSEEIRSFGNELESKMISEQDSIASLAGVLKGDELRASLTHYTVSRGEWVHREWVTLAEHLITKYNDGYIKDDRGVPQEAGYPDEWEKTIISSEPERYVIPDWNRNGAIKDVPY